MKVLMLGWEFPPFISGGLGTACYGLTRAMSQTGTQITFVLPRPIQGDYSSHVKVASPSSLKGRSLSSIPGRAGDVRYELSDFSHVTFRALPSMLQPYQTPETYHAAVEHNQTVLNALRAADIGPEWFLNAEGQYQDDISEEHYGRNLYQEVQRYAALASVVSLEEDFDIIHAHDWMTYPAGIAVAKLSGKPLVVHIHSTEFDRSGEHVNQMVYDIERQGFHAAKRILAVSYLTRGIVIQRYGVPSEKVQVVYNAIDRVGAVSGMNDTTPTHIAKHEKIVLFLGRITMQKGPEYFLHAAKKVLGIMDNVKFVMAGSGDMIRRTIEMAAELGIGHKVLFTGFLRGDDVDKVFRMADLFVMPSVSEPFGLVPLEALRNDVPVLISNQSGVSEILTHALKVDFWDTDEMANKIVAVLRHPPLQMTLREHGNFEVRKLSWMDAAVMCNEVYASVVGS